MIFNSNNKLVWLMMSLEREHVISLFLPSLGEIRLGGFGLLVIYRIVYFRVVFDLVFQTCKNSRTNVFLKSDRPLFEFMVIFLSMRFFKLQYVESLSRDRKKQGGKTLNICRFLDG